MFVRLLVYAGWLALYCFGLMGCGEEDPVSSVETVDEVDTVDEKAIISDVATLIETLPANGEVVSYDRPVVLYFDKPPLAVSVNGTPAKVKGDLVCWFFPDGQTGDKLLHIEWTNPDGTKNVDTQTTVRVVHVNWAEWEIEWAHISDGEADVDPDDFNQDFIRYDFSKPAVVLNAQLLTEEGVDLGWEAVSEVRRFTTTLKLHRGANGQLLENGKRYTIYIVVDEAWVHSSDICKCMDCLFSKKFIIEFATIEA